MAEKRTYEIVTNGRETGIKCLDCNMTSWSSEDVKFKYCGNCHEFHQEKARKVIQNRRAVTDEQKRQIMDKFFHLWTRGDHRYLRFGQMIGNVIRTEGGLYNIEDFDLIDKLEEHYGR